jgi:hypothetical protein
MVIPDRNVSVNESQQKTILKLIFTIRLEEGPLS